MTIPSEENTNANTSSVETPKWFLDEKTPGIGDRPEWLPEKFKTAADMAKSYSELEKKSSVMPEKYDLSRSKYLDPDYEPLKEFEEFARSKRVPKDVIDKFVESVDKYFDEFNTDFAEESKKLGENASERLKVLDNWAKANLTEDSYKAITGNLRDANSIKALEELRGKIMSNNVVVPGGNSETNNTATMEDLQNELNNNLEKYKSDETYRKDFTHRLEIASKSQARYVDKYS